MDKAKAAASKAKDVAEQAAEKAAERAEKRKEEVAAEGAIFVGKSHDEGRNADVTLYADRIERVKDRARLALSSARQDVEITPIKAVSSVQAKKDGFRTKVTVYASGNTIEFRFDHQEAREFNDAIMKLILNKDEATPVAAPSQPDVYDQLKKLGELRDAGVLSAEEFEAKKAELLGRL